MKDFFGTLFIVSLAFIGFGMRLDDLLLFIGISSLVYVFIEIVELIRAR